MERIIFKRNAFGNLVASDADKARVAAAYRANRGTLAREIVDAAAADLVRATNQMMFDSGKSYAEISKHLVDTNPWFGLAVAAIAEHPERSLRDLNVEVESA